MPSIGRKATIASEPLVAVRDAAANMVAGVASNGSLHLRL